MWYVKTSQPLQWHKKWAKQMWDNLSNILTIISLSGKLILNNFAGFSWLNTKQCKHHLKCMYTICKCTFPGISDNYACQWWEKQLMTSVGVDLFIYPNWLLDWQLIPFLAAKSIRPRPLPGKLESLQQTGKISLLIINVLVNLKNWINS